MLAILLLILLSTGARADPVSSPLVGLWMTHDGDGVLSIDPCGNSLCVRIVGSAMANMPRDWRGRSECGERISQVTERSPGAWEGRITDPRNGHVYDVRITAEDASHARLRGFVVVPFLGSTQVWTRYTGHVAEDCRMSR